MSASLGGRAVPIGGAPPVSKLKQRLKFAPLILQAAGQARQQICFGKRSAAYCSGDTVGAESGAMVLMALEEYCM